MTAAFPSSYPKGMCRVFVRPGSVYQVAYEAEEEIQARRFA